MNSSVKAELKETVDGILPECEMILPQVTKIEEDIRAAKTDKSKNGWRISR